MLWWRLARCSRARDTRWCTRRSRPPGRARDGLVERQDVSGAVPLPDRPPRRAPGAAPVRARGAAVAPRAVAGAEEGLVERAAVSAASGTSSRAVGADDAPRRPRRSNVTLHGRRPVRFCCTWARMAPVSPSPRRPTARERSRHRAPQAWRSPSLPMSAAEALPRGARRHVNAARRRRWPRSRRRRPRWAAARVDAQGRVLRVARRRTPLPSGLAEVGPVELAGERRAVDHGAVVPLGHARHALRPRRCRSPRAGRQRPRRCRRPAPPARPRRSRPARSTVAAAEERREARATARPPRAPRRGPPPPAASAGSTALERGRVGRPQAAWPPAPPPRSGCSARRRRPRPRPPPSATRAAASSLAKTVAEPCREARGVGLAPPARAPLRQSCRTRPPPRCSRRRRPSPQFKPKSTAPPATSDRCQHRHGQRRRRLRAHQRAAGRAQPQRCPVALRARARTAAPVPRTRARGERAPPADDVAPGRPSSRARGRLYEGEACLRAGAAALAGRRGMRCAGGAACPPWAMRARRRGRLRQQGVWRCGAQRCRAGRAAGCGPVRWCFGARAVARRPCAAIGYRRSGWAASASRLAARTFAKAATA